MNRLTPHSLLGLFCLCLIFSTWQVMAQPAVDIGPPIFRYWNADSYNAHGQNWGMAQDLQRRLYFANTNGVLIYQGASWEMVFTPNKSAVKSVAADYKGKVYVGSVNDFGYLSPDSIGQLTYHTLTHLLPDSVNGFKDIWDIHCIGDTTYFRSSNCLFKLVGNQISTFFPTKRFHRCYKVNKTIYVTDLGKGLMMLNAQNTLQLLPGGERFINQRIYAMLPHANGKLLICTEKEGLGLFNPKNGDWELIDSPEVNAFLIKNLIYRGLQITQGRYAFGTTAGVLITDAEGKWQQVINKAQGLENDDVLGMDIDKDGALWVGFNYGLARIDTHLPLFNYNSTTTGLSGITYTLVQHKNTLYAGGSKGLYILQPNARVFENTPAETSSIWDLAVMELPKGDTELWMATSNGLFIHKNGKSELIWASDAAMFDLEKSALFPQRLYIGMSKGFAVINVETRKFECYYDSLPYKVRSIAESKNGDLWLGTSYNGYIKVSPKQQHNFEEIYMSHYDTLKGLEDLGNNYLFKLPNQPLIFGSREGWYEYQPKGDSLIASEAFDQQLNGQLTETALLSQSHDGKTWSFGLFNGNNSLGNIYQEQGAYQWDEEIFSRLTYKSVMAMLPDSSGGLWYALPSGEIIHYRDQMREPLLAPTVIISSVMTQNNTLVYGGNSLEITPKITLDYQSNLPVVFNFAATSYARPEATKYRYRLDGYDENWSDWGFTTKKEYTGLWPKTYVFMVQALDVHGKYAETGSIQIVISPPWHLTWLAYFSYIIIGLLIIWGIIRWNIRRLLKEKELLEVIVAERTTEVVLKNAELEQQQEEISTQAENLREANEAITLKNQKITASITYAQRIQEAVQVPASALKSCFDDAFVLLKPKDIVSGDFFWMAEIGNKLVLVLADCTGHGVPGAFMSMIGQMLLKEAVVMYELCKPAEILEALDSMLRSSLRQESTKTQDGMDISICVIDKEAGLLQFAGAKRPLFYVQGGKGFLIKGDKHPIGGQERQMGSHTAFINHEIPFDATQPMTCYMYSDGFPDQFGGIENKKFMSKRFREILLAMHQQPMQQQKKDLLAHLENWQGHHTQIDDVMVIGWKL